MVGTGLVPLDRQVLLVSGARVGGDLQPLGVRLLRDSSVVWFFLYEVG